MEHLNDEKCDICLVQETFLREAEKAILQQIRDYGWQILSNPRKHRTGGGIAILYRERFTLKSNDKVVKPKSFQVMEALMKTESCLIRLVNIYRPGYSQKARHTAKFFLEEFNEYLSVLSEKSGRPILMGDFNFHIERFDDFYAAKFIELLNEYNLQQYTPLVPTHIDGGTLDLIITDEVLQAKLGSFSILERCTPSDHFLVHVDVELKPMSVKEDKKKWIEYRDFSTIVIQDFRKDIMDSPLGNCVAWKTYSLEGAVGLYNTVLSELMDKHSPVIKKKVMCNNTPWIDEELRTLRRRRRAAERAWRKDKESREKRIMYISLCKYFSDEELKKRCLHNKSSLRASSGDTKTLFKKVNRLLGNEVKDLPNHQDSGALAENFKEFFGEKVSKIRSDIEDESTGTTTRISDEDTPGYDAPPAPCSLDGFSCITEDVLQVMISKMSNKFCCLDPVPTYILKDCVSELSPILLHIINSSITAVQFPANLKQAVIKPTVKKQNVDRDILKNYRPVSNLPVISKLLERTIMDQLNSYLNLNDLHCPVQSGYRPHHSCETLLVRMTNDIRIAMQAGNIVIVILLDLSSAFDTIDYTVLLEKLEKDFGICGPALDWFSSYLHGRSFCVNIDYSFSNFFCLLFGVPQGSLLGPILFILYIKQLQIIAAKYGLSVQFYADDSQLYISFYPTKVGDLENITDRANRCLAEIKVWMVENFMKINEDKTELLILGKPSVLKTFDLEITLQFGSEKIKPTKCKGDNWTSLGVKLDAVLNMERQINSVKQKCSWTLINIRAIGCYLDQDIKLMLVKQLVISKLDYCNALYMNICKTRLKKLQSVMNNGVRFIYNITDRCIDLLPFFKKSHILPINERIIFKVALLSYKIAYNIAPSYLNDLVKFHKPTDSLKTTRRNPSEDPTRMVLPKMCTIKASDRCFSRYAPEVWNALSFELRSIKCIDSFKNKLKNYLYNSMAGPI